MRLDMVGRMPSELLGMQRDMLERLSGNDGDLWLERYKRVHRLENPFAELAGTAVSADAWKNELVAATRKKLKKFSKAWAAQVSAIPDSWTPEFLINAARYKMHPVFIPEADINRAFRKASYIKPNDWYYEKVNSGDIKGAYPTYLHKGWCLADFTEGIDYAGGTQTLPDDLWASLIAELRIEREIIGAHSDTPSGSRFSITWEEWIQVVFAHMAAKLPTTRAQINLPTAIEWNFIGNVYACHYGAYNMRTWLQDQFGDDYRLIGGYRDHGGLAAVSSYWHSLRHGSIAGRPLVRFVQ